MTEKYFVICGTRQEFQFFITRKATEMWTQGHTHISLSNFVYVDDVIKMKGCRNPHGWFYGTWYNHTNLYEVITQLMVSTDTHNPKFIELHEEAVRLRKEKNELL